MNDKGNIILYTTPDGASQSVRHLYVANQIIGSYFSIV